MEGTLHTVHVDHNECCDTVRSLLTPAARASPRDDTSCWQGVMPMRRWVPARAATAVRHTATASLVTYNILADGERLAMSSKHDYCSRELREWGDSRRGRCARLVAELSSYEADVICLQECSATAFVQIQDGLDRVQPPSQPSADAQADVPSWALVDGPGHPSSGAVVPAMTGFHASDLLVGQQAREAKLSDTGLATFVRTKSKWRVAGAHAVRLGDLLEEGRHVSLIPSPRDAPTRARLSSCTGPHCRRATCASSWAQRSKT